MKYFCLISIVFSFFFSSISYAQDTIFKSSVNELIELKLAKDDDLLEYFNNSVTSSSRNRIEKVDKAPATVWVVTDEQILLRNYQSLLDVLYDVPDLKIDFAVDPRWSHEVSIRGIRGMDRFIILLDGVKISSPTNDGIPVMENYPINFAKQIEIICGPSSAQYGADAFSGIINIVSKNAAELPKNMLSLSGGQYNTHTSNLFVSKQMNKNTSVMFGGQYHFDRTLPLWDYYPDDYKGIRDGLKTGEFNTIFGKIPTNKVFNPEPSQTAVNAYGFFGKMQWKNLKITAFLNGSKTPSTYANNPDNTPYQSGNFLGHSVGVLNLNYDKQLGKNWKLTSLVTYSRYWLDPESAFQNIYTGFEKAYLFSVGRMFKAEQLMTWTPSTKLELTSGITYESFFSVPRGHDLAYPVTSNDYSPPPIVNSSYPKNLAGISADLPQVRFSNIGAFVQTNYRPTEKLNFVAGLRYDNNTRWGATINPRVGLVWDFLPKTTIKGLFGTAFLAPSPLISYDQYGTFYSLDEGATYQSEYFMLPNPKLKPQTIRTFEVNLNSYLHKNFRLNVSGFRSAISGLFTYVSDAAHDNIYQGKYKGYDVGYIEIVINQGEQTNYGGSVRLDYITELKKNSKLNLYASYSYADGVVKDESNAPNSTLAISGVTPHIFRGGIEFSFSKWQFSIRGIGVGSQRTFATSLKNPLQKQEIAGYLLVNASTRYRFNNNFTAFLSVKNLLDQRYYNVNIGAAPEGVGQGGSASAELSNGAPQNPIRINIGLQIGL